MPKTYFISYNKNDVAWAEWIGWHVENFGSKVIIQAWDFLPGKSWVQEMHDATKSSDATICVLTADFLNSGFTAAEWQIAFADDPVGRLRKLIPIKVKQCEPDGLLKTRIYGDLVGKDQDAAKEILKRCLMEGRQKPNNEPLFPADHGSEPNFPNSKVKYAFVLDGIYSEDIKERVETLLTHIQKAVNGGSITITEITEGSMILHLESSYDVYRQLQREFIDNPEFSVDGKSVLGIWLLDRATKKPMEQRLEFYRDRLIKFFLAEKLDRETARDLTQDVLINLYADPARYKYLSSPSLIVNLARVALTKFASDKEEDARARSGYINPTGEIEWDEVYRTSISVLERLPQGDRFILENFWDSRFVEGKFDQYLEEEQVRQIDISVQMDIQSNLDGD